MGGGAVEDAAAAGGKEGVAAKEMGLPACLQQVAEVGLGVAGGVPNFHLALPERPAAAFAYGVGGVGDVVVGVNAAVGELADELGQAGGVVGVVVGNPDLAQRQAVGFQVAYYGGGIAGVDADGFVALLEQPDVVVGKGWDRGDFEHDGDVNKLTKGWPIASLHSILHDKGAADDCCGLCSEFGVERDFDCGGVSVLFFYSAPPAAAGAGAAFAAG